jgi:glycosyltransferase involved in cell wall biosynthesis
VEQFMSENSQRSASPEVSVVIPIYNEEATIEWAVRGLCEKLRRIHLDFELVLSANGCVDRSVMVANMLKPDVPELVILESSEPNYGKALRSAIVVARGKYVVCDEIDLCDVGFYTRALALLREGSVDLVVGSKALPGSDDRRPIVRKVATRVFNGMLRLSTGFRGTDTHGLKAFNRERLAPVVAGCVFDKDLFASELVIRAQKLGKEVIEIPVGVEEQRKSPIHLFNRVPAVVRNMIKLGGELRDLKQP